ncbi:MAG: cytochrome c3 family protein [Candidatus Marinimicrobia bacterium]|nr:cytochrome c3 family protein [Candidatus Neomarinimicrobiota bacterium]
MKLTSIYIRILVGLIGIGIMSPRILMAEEELNTCVSCHVENDLMPQDYIMEDVHQHSGLSCAGCHGGDPTAEDMDESMSPDKGYIGIPAYKDTPAFCGKCHSKIEFMRVYQPRIPTDQEDQYHTSMHGKKLLAGDQGVAQCSSCHTSHAILPAKDTRSSVHPYNIPATCDRCHGDSELMAARGRKTDQFSDYAKSVHGTALLEKGDTGAPACNDCHGNHGAAPPGAESVSHICGSCHLNNIEFFKTSKMGQSFESADYHSCEQCHGNHAIMKPSDEFLNVHESSLCLECHSDGDEGYLVAESMYTDIKDTDSLYQAAQLHLLDIQIKGMNDVDIAYLLKESKQNLIQLRTMVHTFDADQVAEKAVEGKGLSSQAIELAGDEIHEFNRRRVGFGIATLAFVLLALAVYFKIRQIDSQESNPSNEL